MPELPEVETVKESLKSRLVGRKIKSVNISDEINGDNTRTITMEIHNPFQMPVQCAISEKEEVSDECEECNDVECTDIVKMFYIIGFMLGMVAIYYGVWM